MMQELKKNNAGLTFPIVLSTDQSRGKTSAKNITKKKCAQEFVGRKGENNKTVFIFAGEGMNRAASLSTKHRIYTKKNGDCLPHASGKKAYHSEFLFLSHGEITQKKVKLFFF